MSAEKEFRIHEENGRFGLKDNEGNIIIAAVFDEAQEHETSFHMRKCNDQINFCAWDINQAEVTISSNSPLCELMDFEKHIKDGVVPLITDELYSAVKPDVADDGSSVVYQDGKFKYLLPDGMVLLEAIYDEIQKWPDANVIYARKGKEHLYFDLKGKRILTEIDNYQLSYAPPFYVKENPNDDALEVCSFSEILNSHSFEGYGGYVSLERWNNKGIKDALLRADTWKKEFDAKQVEIFFNKNTYIKRGYIARSKDTINPIHDCVKQLERLRCYRSTWSYLIKVCTNSRTNIEAEAIELLRYRVEDIKAGYGNLSIAYAIDDSLQDGEVIVLQIEYFSDHWPSEKEMELYTACDNADADVIERLAKEDPDCAVLVEDLLFNFRYFKSLVNKSKEDIEDFLNRMKALGSDVSEMGISVCRAIANAESNEEFQCALLMLDWVTHNGYNPDAVRYRTSIADYLLAFVDQLKNEVQNRGIQVPNDFDPDNTALRTRDQLRALNPYFVEDHSAEKIDSETVIPKIITLRTTNIQEEDMKNPYQKWMLNGEVLYPIPGSTTLYDSPGCGVFQIYQNPQTHEIGLIRISDEFQFNFKMYEVGCEDMLKHIQTYWNNSEVKKGKKNLGVIFNGIKGTGKTIAAKLLCNQLKLPVIIVSHNINGLLEFIQNLDFECVILIDEAEKTFNSDENEVLLKLIDGVYNRKRKLYILTTNHLSLDENLMGRPGRIRYIKQFNNLSLEVVQAYLDDNLKNQDCRQEILQLVDRLEISTIDILKSIVDEANIFGKVDIKTALNIPLARYTFEVLCFSSVDKEDEDKIKAYVKGVTDFRTWLKAKAAVTPDNKSPEDAEYTNKDYLDDISFSYTTKLSTNSERLFIGQSTNLGNVVEPMSDNGVFVVENQWSESRSLCIMLSPIKKPSIYNQVF